MDSALTTVGLPLALAIIMFGLGLDLTVADFRRVGRAPKAVAVALACQVVLLPGICFGLVVLFGYSWALIHHALGGIRHFVWDTGAGFGPGPRELFAKLTIGGSIALTAVLWIVIWLVKG